MKRSWFALPVLACGLAVIALAQETERPADTQPATPEPDAVQSAAPAASTADSAAVQKQLPNNVQAEPNPRRSIDLYLSRERKGPPNSAAAAHALDMELSGAEARAPASQELRGFDLQAARLAAQLRTMSEGAGAAEQAAELHARLRSVVSMAFDGRQFLQRAELDKLRRRLQAIEQTIAARERSKEEIIERRVAELLNPELEWEPAAPTTVSGNPLVGGTTPGVSPETSELILTGPMTRREPTTSRPARESDAGIGLPAAIHGGPVSGGGVILRSPAEFGTMLVEADVKLRHVQRLRENGFADEESVKLADRSLRLLQDEYAAQLRLLELELSEAETRYESVATALKRLKSLVENGTATTSELDRTALASEEAKLRVQRLHTLLNLYRKAQPEEQGGNIEPVSPDQRNPSN